ncbi:unnamed protein product [Tuber aestivum]|uniref:Uncharacterized protein n=1 Tax=Tuber aestivum TaxID=59557 RepID=A0A292PWD7_9PEZI|nr:unnamed protein product [Tuber aestivum]
MLLSLPDPRESSRSRRSPLTPPSVTPPSVSVTGSSTMQSERDRCTSPSQTATTLLAKVAAPQPQTGTTPSSPRMAMSNSSSASSTPLSTPPGDGCHFPFGSMQKGLPESPDGTSLAFAVHMLACFTPAKVVATRTGLPPPPRFNSFLLANSFPSL